MKSIIVALVYSLAATGTALAEADSLPSGAPMADSAAVYDSLPDAGKIDYHERCIADLSIYEANAPRLELMAAAKKVYDLQVLQAAALLKTADTDAVIARPGVDRYIKFYMDNDFAQFKKTVLQDTNSCIHNAMRFMSKPDGAPIDSPHDPLKI